MNFLNPLAFLLLLTAPLLVLLYFLKLKRPQVRVSSTLLWQKVIEDMRVNSPFQKLKKSLLLLLQLLALIAAILALARPFWQVHENVDESFIVLLDNSASMAARDEDGKTRLELARAEIATMIDRLSRQDEMMIVAFHTRADVGCGFTSNRRQLRQALDAIGTTDCRTDLRPALLLAKSICDSRTRPRVVLFSDGRFRPTTDVEMPVDIEYRAIGTPVPNLAVTGLDIRRSLNDHRKIEMFVAVENFSQQVFTGNMVVRLDGRELDSKFFSVRGGEVLTQVFEADLPGGGKIEVEFDVDDALACDNSAWKIISSPVRHRVLAVGEQPFFIQRALAAMPNVECRTAGPGQVSDALLADYSTVVWDNVRNAQAGPQHNIYFNCVPTNAGFRVVEQNVAVEGLDWVGAHALNRFLDYDNLVISSGLKIEPPEFAASIVRCDQGPLIFWMAQGTHGICVVGFDPVKSNWPLLVSFPLFLKNCLSEFETLRSRLHRTNIAAGDPLRVRSTSRPTVRTPGGDVKPLRTSTEGSHVFGETHRCGIYTVQLEADRAFDVAANLFDREESELAIEEAPSVGGKKVRTAEINKQVNQEFWKVILACLGVLLVAEWTAYHRRWFV